MKRLKIILFILVLMVIPNVVKAATICTPASKQKYSGYGFIATKESNQYIEGVEYKCDLGNGKKGEFYVIHVDGNNVYLIYEKSLPNFAFRGNAVKKLKDQTKTWSGFDDIILPPDKWLNKFSGYDLYKSCKGSKTNDALEKCYKTHFSNYMNEMNLYAKENGINTTMEKHFLILNLTNVFKYWGYTKIGYIDCGDRCPDPYTFEFGYLIDYNDNVNQYVIGNTKGMVWERFFIQYYNYGSMANDNYFKVRPVVKVKKSKIAKLSSAVPTATNQYLITFNSNGGSAIGSQVVNKDGVVTKPANPTRLGYNFVGWYSDVGLTKAYNFATRVTANMTLYAKYNPITYTVTFNSNGGSTIANQVIVVGNKAVSHTPLKSGYSFVGWYTDTALTKAYNFASAVNSNITLYAKWTALTPANYTVIFNSNGGSAIANQTIASGNKATRPTSPTRDGYKFNDWYSDSELNNVYDFTSAITGNITLYAKWIEDSKTTHNISFDGNGGTGSMASITVESGASYKLPKSEFGAPSKKKFNGWIVGEELKQVGENITISGDTSVKAQWTDIVPTEYTVTFNSNGGNEVESKQVISGNVVERPDDPVKEGYSFENWYADSDLTIVFSFKVPIVGNTTVYAKYEKITEDTNTEEKEQFSDVSRLLSLIDEEYEDEKSNFKFSSNRERILYAVNSGVSAGDEVLVYGVFANTSDDKFMWTEEKNLSKDAIFETNELKNNNKKYKDIKTKVNKKLSNKVKNMIVYDLSVKLNNEVVQPNGKSYVYIPIPKEYNEKKTVVYRQESNGTLTRLESEVSNGYILFETEHFSNYAIVEYDYDGSIQELEENPKTGSIIPMWIIIGLSAAALLIRYFVMKKKVLYKI